MSQVNSLTLHNGLPDELTLTITAEQALVVANLLGMFSPGKAGSSYVHGSELYECLSDLFNRFYEDGVDEANRERGLSRVPLRWSDA